MSNPKIIVKINNSTCEIDCSQSEKYIWNEISKFAESIGNDEFEIVGYENFGTFESTSLKELSDCAELIEEYGDIFLHLLEEYHDNDLYEAKNDINNNYKGEYKDIIDYLKDIHYDVIDALPDIIQDNIVVI